MSKSYTVVSGDTLGSISIKYYGVWTKWNRILNSNPQLVSRKKNFDGSPVIYPGDILIIPTDTELPASVVNSTPVVLDENADADISIYIDGKLYTGFTGYTLQMPMDGLAAFSFATVWDDEKKNCMIHSDHLCISR